MSEIDKNNKPFVIPPPDLSQLQFLPPNQRSLAYRAFRVFSLLVFSISVALGIFAYLWLDNLGAFDISESTFKTLIEYRSNDNSIVFDRDGEKIGEYFHHYHHYVPYKDLPQSLINAIIAIEDRDFFHHFGIDPKGMLRASASYLENGHITQGASTITQQVVRNTLLNRRKTMNRKMKEIALALRLEQILTKEKILEIYTNHLFLGSGAYGVGAAAFRYFGKQVPDLKPHEAALIAGLFQSPTAYNPHRYPKRAKQRQRQVLRAMYQTGFLSKHDAIALSKKKLEYHPYSSLNLQLAPYFVDYVRQEAARLVGKKLEGQGLRIHTTLDSKLQTLANETFKNKQDHFKEAELLVQAQNVNEPKSKKNNLPLEGAMVSIDPQTGELLAMVGGRDYQISKFNRVTQSLRSPGSAFKPIVYSLALLKGRKWSDLMFVAPVSVNGYRPKNFSDQGFLTETTMLRAFYRSLNTATIEIGMELGLDEVVRHAKKLGIKSPLKLETGTLLGSSALSMLELAEVYSVFANAGIHHPITAITRIYDRRGKTLYEAPQRKSERIIPTHVAYLTTKGLQAVMRHGTASRAASLASHAAGKTGTSNKAVDNWFCGYSSNLLSVVWVGTDDQSPMSHRATGGSLALPVWQDFMTRAFKIRKPGQFKRPGNVLSLKIDPKYGHRSDDGIVMYFSDRNVPKRKYSEFKSIEDSGQYRSLFSH